MIFADDVTKAQSEISEEELLSKGRWSQYKANEALHRPDENHHARRRCRQLIEGGVGAISWDDLIGMR